jgi:hypothetical protein
MRYQTPAGASFDRRQDLLHLAEVQGFDQVILTALIMNYAGARRPLQRHKAPPPRRRRCYRVIQEMTFASAETWRLCSKLWFFAGS